VVYSDQAVTSGAQPVEIEGSSPVADVEVRATDAPPPLPDYEQPPCPEEGYLWTPGYWAWGPAGYYWVPGAWAQPPRVGVLWTPGYWNYVGAVYVFHRGYWAPHIGYYGGINYGFGYSGVGFAGGHWVGHSFAYNRAVNHVDEHVFQHTYNEAVYNSAPLNSGSYNGGPGGTTSVPTAQERAVAAEPHIPPTPLQRQYMTQAARNPALMPHTSFVVNQPGVSADHRPTAAIPKPIVFNAPAATNGTPSSPSHSQLALAHAPPPTNRVSAPPQPAVTHPSTSTSMRARSAGTQRPTH
jgi:WXXGXW repeat (2 copies)